jgi:hypothetical protein
MPIQITQREENGRTYLHVEGEMLLDDALLLEKIVGTLEVESDNVVAVDLADPISLTVIQHRSSAASRITATVISKHRIFLQSAVNSVERTAE